MLPARHAFHTAAAAVPQRGSCPNSAHLLVYTRCLDKTAKVENINFCSSFSLICCFGYTSGRLTSWLSVSLAYAHHHIVCIEQHQNKYTDLPWCRIIYTFESHPV